MQEYLLVPANAQCNSRFLVWHKCCSVLSKAICISIGISRAADGIVI